MIKHNNYKTFQEKMKNEEMQLNKQRIAVKPEIDDISSITDRIDCNLEPAAQNFNILQFSNNFEQIITQHIQLADDIYEKSKILL